MFDWHHINMEDRMYINVGEGKKAGMPRYYKDKIYSQSERERVGFFSRIDALKRQTEADDKLKEQYGDQWHVQKEELKQSAYQKMARESKLRNPKI